MNDNNFFEMGENCRIHEGVIIGLKYSDHCEPTRLGNNATVRTGSIIYADVQIGDDFKTGHNVVIREQTVIGSKIVIGTNVVIDGQVTIGDFVKIETGAYIPTHTTIGNKVFIGPNVIMTNDKYPQRCRDSYKPEGPIIRDSVSIGGNVTILPGVEIGEGSVIAAGSVVTKDVPPWSLVKGVPGQVEPIPEFLKHENRAIAW